MKYRLRFLTLTIILTAASWLDLFGQTGASVHMSGTPCVGVPIDFYLQSTSCGETMGGASSWFFNVAPSVTVFPTPGVWGHIRVTWNAPVSGNLVTANYSYSSPSCGTGVSSAQYPNMSAGDPTLNITNMTAPAAPTFTLNGTNGNQTVCQGTNVIVAATNPNSGSNSNYQYILDGTVLSMSATYTYPSTPANYTLNTASLSPGSHTFTVAQVNIAGGCYTTTTTTATTVTININAPNVYTVTLAGFFCSAGTNTLTASIIGSTSGTLSYQWYRNGVSYSTTSVPTLSGMPGVLGDFWTCVVSSTGCDLTNVRSNMCSIDAFQAGNTPTVSINYLKFGYCVGDAITFNAIPSNSGTLTYNWTLNGTVQSNHTSTISIPVAAATTAGYYSSGSTLSVSVSGMTGTCLTSSTASVTAPAITISPTSVAGTLSVNQANVIGTATLALSVSGLTGTISRFMVRQQDDYGTWTPWVFSSAAPAVTTLPGITRHYQFQAFVQNGPCAEAATNVVSVNVINSTDQGVGCISGLQITAKLSLCAFKFSTMKLNNCISSYTWHFGDGATSIERNPMHVYASGGTYTVSLTVTYDCNNACVGTTTATTTVVYPSTITPQFEADSLQIITNHLTRVVANSASSYTDAWAPLFENTAGAVPYLGSVLQAKNSFENGKSGTWRNQSTNVYNVNRASTPSPILRADGTYTLDQFSWAHAMDNMVANWTHDKVVTQYSGYSYELENSDALGIYSAALYDYNGQLPTATGVNMKNQEMGYTSFEVSGWNANTQSTGNFVFGASSLPKQFTFNVIAANNNLALVDAPIASLTPFSTVNVTVSPFYWKATWLPNFWTFGDFIKDDPIICMKANPNNANQTIIVLRTAPQEMIWTGTLTVVVATATSPAASFSATGGHTGTGSLFVTTTTAWPQPLLTLDPNKSYYFNCWVTLPGATSLLTPLNVADANIGVDVIIRNTAGTQVNLFTFRPSGPVIEGWQQITGSFTPNTGITPPALTLGSMSFDLRLKQGASNPAYYDDLRLFPFDGNMKSYVYDINTLKPSAILDEQNFASFFYYDVEGNLYLTKKETKDGVKTIQENVSYKTH